jgi:predicted short-subunit dehydrogenase-like oxidoreductase (DUF2520 family)
MKIVCIGAGQMAHQLMPALEKAGCEVIQVYNRTLEAANLLAAKLRSAIATDDLTTIHPDADIYFLAVSDDAIKTVAEDLKKVIDADKLVLHASGVLNLDELPFEKKATFYPLQSFSDNHDVSWQYIPIIITTNDDDVWIELDQIAAKMSSTVYRMTDLQKSYLHLSAVFANNFSNHMMTLAEVICKEHEYPFEILKPLILETFTKAILAGPSVSQTGPAIRGDEKTIEKHLNLLAQHPELAPVYKIVTKSIEDQNR